MGNRGRNILLYADEKTTAEVRAFDFDKFINDGFMKIKCTCMLSGLPAYFKDMGIYDSHHVFISRKGIIIYSYYCGGYIRKTPVSFRGKNLKRPGAEYFFCPWSGLTPNKSTSKPIVFLNRNRVFSFKVSMQRYHADVASAALKFVNGTYSPMSSIDKIMNDKATNGIYVDDYIFIRKHDKSRHYYYEKWLSVKDFLKIQKILAKVNTSNND